ncbi:relaxase/mobilization nuclease domain-containing protein [Fusicatenibacter sp.]
MKKQIRMITYLQSFKPGEVDAETAHRLGQQFADEVLKGKYEYVISTPVDKNHIHNHIIFNAASFVDHHKYVSNKRSYHKLCRISNRICHENGLATSMPTGEKGKSYKENMEYHRSTSWKAKLRVAVDKAIWTSINYEEFLQKMQLAGYEVRQGKHLSFRAPEQKNFTYMKSLGSYYSEENVRIRLKKNRNKVKAPKYLTREARLYINISTYVTTGNQKGFEHWAKLNNLKEAARTFNYLSENNLLNYEDFRQHVSDVDASVKAADQRIAQIASELSTQKVIQKHCDSYRLCRKVIEDCKSAKNPKTYRAKHQAEYQLHDSLKKELQDLGVTKIPSSNKIQKQIENLESEQAATVREIQELQKKQKTLDIIRQNFTALLYAPEISSDLLPAKRDSLISSYYLWTFLLHILNMIKDIPIKESHIITFVSSPVFTFGVRLLLSPDGSSETGGVFVVIGGIDSFLNLGSAVTFQII